jgi:hypothetical protein
MTEYHQFLQYGGNFVPFQEFLEDYRVLVCYYEDGSRERGGSNRACTLQLHAAMRDGDHSSAGGILTWTVHIVNRGLAIIRPTLTKKGRDNTLRLLSGSILFQMIITGLYLVAMDHERLAALVVLLAF